LSRVEADATAAADGLRAFIEDGSVRTLNVAGPRASQEPEIGAFVLAVLTAAFPRGNADSSLRSE
jgi:hypothetical protein